jgi:hypothetical protein
VSYFPTTPQQSDPHQERRTLPLLDNLEPASFHTSGTDLMAACHIECRHSPQRHSAPVAWASCTPDWWNDQIQEQNLHDMPATRTGSATITTGCNGRYKFPCPDPKPSRFRLSDVVFDRRYVVGRLPRYSTRRRPFPKGQMVYSRWRYVLLGTGNTFCQLPPSSMIWIKSPHFESYVAIRRLIDNDV